MKNLFFELLDVDKVRSLVDNCPKDETVILLPHYSINIQSKYEDDQIFDDWDDFESAIGISMQINDYDDLIADPYGLMY